MMLPFWVKPGKVWSGTEVDINGVSQNVSISFDVLSEYTIREKKQLTVDANGLAKFEFSDLDLNHGDGGLFYAVSSVGLPYGRLRLLSEPRAGPLPQVEDWKRWEHPPG